MSHHHIHMFGHEKPQRIYTAEECKASVDACTAPLLARIAELEAGMSQLQSYADALNERCIADTKKIGELEDEVLRMCRAQPRGKVYTDVGKMFDDLLQSPTDASTADAARGKGGAS